ncbi:hypothetical protein H6778_03615 [Candidatus Nomurabacteria bacterium]|uniref:Uncharacterized protein n=1 Tax=candidate division WWE3 bacterium TaxID=2053526 RepID=A0A955LVQ5_UNCKA|nr:hypothetical protein [candidate division WWE3 bacterium]MCB9812717.1 hypothetical protein [Candidatus Nomurabacteria bacterium]
MDTKKSPRDEAIKHEAEHYDEVPLWKSFRGYAVLGIGLLGGIMSVHQIYLQEYVYVVIFISVLAMLLYFVAKGHLWSVFVLMLLIVFHSISNWIYFGVIEQKSGAWMALFFGFVILSYFMMPVLRVEQKRRFLQKQAKEGRVIDTSVLNNNHEDKESVKTGSVDSGHLNLSNVVIAVLLGALLIVFVLIWQNDGGERVGSGQSGGTTLVTAQELVDIELSHYRLPYKIDNGFYVFDVHAVSRSEIAYSIQATNYAVSDIDWTEFGPVLKGVMTSDYCKTDAKDSDIIFTYKYFDKVKEHIGSYSITPRDCF